MQATAGLHGESELHPGCHNFSRERPENGGMRWLRGIAITTAWILLWTLTVAGVVLAEAFWIGPPDFPRGDVRAIDTHLAGMFGEARIGSGALLLVQDGRIVAEHATGVANARTGAPVDFDRTLYQVASVSKAVTAWGVMRLVQEGKITLDEPVLPHLKRWRFPGSEAHRDKITLRHLLSHTAGLNDGLGYGGFPADERIQTLEESLTLARDSTVGAPRAAVVVREPGQAMSYSGAGYTVLQLLIEEITQRPFAEYMNDAVLQPLGMTHSSFDIDAVVAAGRPDDLATRYDRKIAPLPHRHYTAKAAAALFAPPRDLAAFAQAFARPNPVLRPESVRLMLQPQAGTGGSWGLGHTLYAPNGAGGHVVGHSGGSFPASGAVVKVNPATGNAIVLVASGGRVSLSRMADDWLYWETGIVTPAARRQIAQDRIRPASLAIALGAIFIITWQLKRRAARAR